MNGVELVFGVFNVMGHFVAKAENHRKGGYAYKIFSFLGLILLGAVAIGFTLGAAACFKNMNDNIVAWFVLLILGIICVVVAVYSAFYFIVETISLVIIIFRLVVLQKKYEQMEKDGLINKDIKKDENGEFIHETMSINGVEVDIHDQYQKDNFDDLKPKKKDKRKSFMETMIMQQNQPFLRTKKGFDLTLAVLYLLLIVGFIGLELFAIAA